MHSLLYCIMNSTEEIDEDNRLVFYDRFEITIKYCSCYDDPMHERMHSPKLLAHRTKNQ